MSDMLTWVRGRLTTRILHAGFLEYAEWCGTHEHYPFASPRLVRLGLHLPSRWKYRGGHLKWLWRRFASQYLGADFAFRRKHSFPTLTESWLDRAGPLLRDGFLEDLLCMRVSDSYSRMPPGEVSRWMLLNIELWGRLHIRREGSESLLDRLL